MGHEPTDAELRAGAQLVEHFDATMPDGTETLVFYEDEPLQLPQAGEVIEVRTEAGQTIGHALVYDEAVEGVSLLVSPDRPTP